MIKKLLVLTAALAICSTAFAQDGGGDDPKKPPAKKKRAARKPTLRSLLKFCPVISRLGLSEEQVAKVKALEAEVQAKLDKLCEAAGDDRKKLREVQKQLKTMTEELRKKIVELLTDEQKKKYEVGMVLLTEYEKKLRAARAEMIKARKAAGGDKDKAKEAMTAFREKVKALRTELNKQLDEKIGKRAGRPARKKRPAKKPPEKKDAPEAPDKEAPDKNEF